MIGYVKGKLLHDFGGEIILENNGVGFSITPSAEAYKDIVANGGGAVYTYMAVREDGVSLYGFSSREEKNMFLKLISVSGVGPKMGITVLSNMDLNSLALAIAMQDVKTLSKVKGLGKKTAERIILELREKITEVDKETGEITMEKPDLKFETENEDAIIALMGLGFTKAECVKAVKDAKSNGATTIEQLMSYALRHIK
jgi:Holliday junction DNA helicase RuvA